MERIMLEPQCAQEGQKCNQGAFPGLVLCLCVCLEKIKLDKKVPLGRDALGTLRNGQPLVHS